VLAGPPLENEGCHSSSTSSSPSSSARSGDSRLSMDMPVTAATAALQPVQGLGHPSLLSANTSPATVFSCR